MTTGELIKYFRQKRGLTQKELAEELGVPYQSIYQWESGRRIPKIDTVAKIASVLDRKIGDFYLTDYAISILDPSSPQAIAKNLEKDPDFYKIKERPPIEEQGKLNPDIVDRIHREQRLLDHFHQLNPQGQEKAVEQVELVAKVPEYRADQDHEDKEKRPHT